MQEIDDFGIISLMYHRFEENKYPSTNIKLKDFKEHLKIIKEKNISFINPKNFEQYLKNETIFFDESILLIFKHCASVVKRKQRVCLPSTSKAAAVSREIFCHNHACTVAHVHI